MPLGARYYPLTGAVKPYVSAGAGLGWTDLTNLEEINRRFNSLLRASLGVRESLTRGRVWSLKVRLAHISNGGTKLPNPCLNSLILLAGCRMP